MIWHSGWKLASAVSNCGGLGLIGAGSMYPDILRENIQKCKQATDKPFGVNVPMLYPNLEEIIQIILEEGVKIVFTSAGKPENIYRNPSERRNKGCSRVSSTKFAVKCEDAGVDAVVAEGFEAGGHNGRDETTTFCLIPNVRKHISNH
jgi:enoyl-[acyl-carrier protein] reductase II